MNIDIEQIITQCLEGDRRRIIIPGFGAFIKRPEGELVFIDILNTDDGTLIAELQRRTGLTGDEARQAIDKYSYHLKTELLYNKAVKIEGIGTVRMTSDGSFDIELPAAEVAEEVAAAEHMSANLMPEAAPMPEQEEWGSAPGYASKVGQSEEIPEPKSDEGPAFQHEPALEEKVIPELGKTPAKETPVAAEDVPAELIHAVRSQRDREALRELLYGDDDAEEVIARHNSSAEVSDKATEGQQEGTSEPGSQKTLYRSNRYNFDNDSQPGQEDSGIQGSTHIELRKPRKKRVDFVIIIAIIALLVFAGVFIYGEVSNGNINIDLKELIHSGDGESASSGE